VTFPSQSQLQKVSLAWFQKASGKGEGICGAQQQSVRLCPHAGVPNAQSTQAAPNRSKHWETGPAHAFPGHGQVINMLLRMQHAIWVRQKPSKPLAALAAKGPLGGPQSPGRKGHKPPPRNKAHSHANHSNHLFKRQKHDWDRGDNSGGRHGHSTPIRMHPTFTSANRRFPDISHMVVYTRTEGGLRQVLLSTY
jgi:hypothetical protein